MKEQGFLPGFDEIKDVTEEDGISPLEAQRISAEARQAFETMGFVTWMDDYLKLRGEGWPWRVACYIAWAGTPRKGRWPESQEELASVLGLKSTRAIRRWREKNPEIDARVASLSVGPLMKFRANALETLGSLATTKDHKMHPDRKLYFEMVGDYTPRQEMDLGLSGGVQVTSDEMAQAKREADEWERERFSDDDDDDGDSDSANDDADAG